MQKARILCLCPEQETPRELGGGEGQSRTLAIGTPEEGFYQCAHLRNAECGRMHGLRGVLGGTPRGVDHRKERPPLRADRPKIFGLRDPA